MREIVATGMKPEEGEEGSNPITIQMLRKGRSLLTFRESGLISMQMRVPCATSFISLLMCRYSYSPWVAQWGRCAG